MAKGRMISNSISTSVKLLMLYDLMQERGLGEYAQLLYTWIIPHTDDYGRMDADPRVLKMKVMPGSQRDTNDTHLATIGMTRVGLVRLYDGGKYLEIVDFDAHQLFRSDRPRKAKYPIPKEYDEIGGIGIPMGDKRQPMGDICQSKLSQAKLSQAITISTADADLADEVPPVGELKNDLMLEDEKEEETDTPETVQSETVKELVDLAERLYKTKTFPKAHAWLNTHVRKKGNEAAMLHTLKQLASYASRNRGQPCPDPWAYCEKIIRVESGNFNEREHVQRDKKIKEMYQDLAGETA